MVTNQESPKRLDVKHFLRNAEVVKTVEEGFVFLIPFTKPVDIRPGKGRDVLMQKIQNLIPEGFSFVGLDSRGFRVFAANSALPSAKFPLSDLRRWD